VRAEPEPRLRVRRLGPEDWAAWRDLRLEALADTPIGFAELYADAVLRSDEEWEQRINHPPSPGVRFLAYDGERAVGMAGGFHDDDGDPILFAVYVTPDARGGGVVEALVDAVAAWAAPAPLVLDVHVDNARARRAYLRLGFVETGEVDPTGGIDGRPLLRMRR
jgi:RimJ/RimL family protein N-acetyltransferase